MTRPGPVCFSAVLRRRRGHGSPSEATTDRATGGILADQLEYGANHHRGGELCVSEPAKVSLTAEPDWIMPKQNAVINYSM